MPRHRGAFAPLTLALLALPAFAQAELTRLDTDLVPADRFVHPGDSVSVTAAGDTALTLEYRFQVQYHNGTAWETVASGAWASTNSYEFAPVAETHPHGNYRLVTRVREAGVPSDFLVNYQAFSYGPADQSLCDYLDGKTFLNTGTTTPASFSLGSLSTSAALTLLGTPGLPVSLASHATGVSSIAFDNGTVSVTMVDNVHVTASITGGIMPMSIDSDVSITAPLSGTYTCNDDVVTIADASGAATLDTVSGMVGTLLGGSTVYFEASGNATANSTAGTLSTGGVVFALPAIDEPAPEDDGGGALTLLPLLAALGLRRRKR